MTKTRTARIPVFRETQIRLRVEKLKAEMNEKKKITWDQFLLGLLRRGAE